MTTEIVPEIILLGDGRIHDDVQMVIRKNETASSDESNYATARRPGRKYVR